MKKFLSIGFIIANLLMAINNSSWSQTPEPDGLSCATANPFCSDSSYYFPNFSTGSGVTAPVGPDYGCLGSEPNPIWYYFQIDDPGTMELSIYQTSSVSGLGIDVDFAMWGPFTDLATGCAQIMSGTLAPLQCSFSASASETIGLGLPGGAGSGASTPPPAVSGEIYVVLLTNYSGQPGYISFEQTGGTATTDCSIINCGLTLNSNSPVCQGDNLYLTSTNSADTGTISYSWTGPAGFTSTSPNPSLTMSTPGTYTFSCASMVVLGIDTAVCVEEIEVVVNPEYNFNETAEICGGEIYNWQGGVYYTSGNYSQTFKTINGCDSIYKLNLTVNPLPDIRVDANTTSICEGEEAKLTMLNPGTGNSFQWLKDGAKIVGATQSSYAATQSGEYRVIATTSKGCKDTSRVITVTVNPNPDAHINNLEFNTAHLCLGDTVKISAEFNPDYEYRWSPEKFFRYTSGGRQATIFPVVSEPAYIVLTAYNQYGCTDVDSIWVNPVPCCDVYIPTAFSPNGDGANDYFNIKLQPGQRIVSFQIFDRFGAMVYDNNDRINGWNGLIKNTGAMANQAVYFYRIAYSCTDGRNYEAKGDITLVR